MNCELPDVQAGFRKGRGTRDHIANIRWIIKKARVSEKQLLLHYLLTMPKPLSVWITTNWKILKEMGIPDHLTCLLRNLYVDQEAGQMVWYAHLFQNFPQFVVIHTVKDFGTVNKAEVDVFLKLSLF